VISRPWETSRGTQTAKRGKSGLYGPEKCLYGALKTRNPGDKRDDSEADNGKEVVVLGFMIPELIYLNKSIPIWVHFVKWSLHRYLVIP